MLGKADIDLLSFGKSARYIDGRSEESFDAHLQTMIKNPVQAVLWYGKPAELSRGRSILKNEIRKFREREEEKRIALHIYWIKKLSEVH